MAETRIVSTSAGPVEIVQVPGEQPPVLFFPGGHCTAKCDSGWGLYTELGHAVGSLSRSGYGGTRVGPLSAAESRRWFVKCVSNLISLRSPTLSESPSAACRPCTFPKIRS